MFINVQVVHVYDVMVYRFWNDEDKEHILIVQLFGGAGRRHFAAEVYGGMGKRGRP